MCDLADFALSHLKMVKGLIDPGPEGLELVDRLAPDFRVDVAGTGGEAVRVGQGQVLSPTQIEVEADVPLVLAIATAAPLLDGRHQDALALDVGTGGTIIERRDGGFVSWVKVEYFKTGGT